MFALGFILGFFVTFASSPFLPLFGDYPCLITSALIINSMYSFYVYMLVYETSGFTNPNFLFYMIFAWISFGEAINFGDACWSSIEDHGFNQNNKQLFTLPQFSGLNDRYGFLAHMQLTSYFMHIFSLFGQSSSADTASIIAVVGVIGIQTVLQAFADYNTYIERFRSGDHFGAGVFLGKAAVAAAVVVFLLMFAVEAG